MYNQNYEEYMRTVLGYPVQSEDTYRKSEDYYTIPMSSSYRNCEIEKMYPEVYKIIYPKVCNICQRNFNSDITDESLENMANEIYTSLEADGNINFYKIIENRNESEISAVNRNNINTNRNNNKIEERENRQRNNALLDIIRILILREFLNKPQTMPPYPGSRPPMPPYPGQRPPMPPYPGSIPRNF